jgi:hypothetical protein
MEPRLPTHTGPFGRSDGVVKTISETKRNEEDARSEARTPTAQRHAAPRRQPPHPPRRRRLRAPLVLSRRARLPVRASRAAAAPHLRLLQRLGDSAAPGPLLALDFAGPRPCRRRLRLRAGGEARDLHGRRAALRARARHRVADRALEVPPAARGACLLLVDAASLGLLLFRFISRVNLVCAGAQEEPPADAAVGSGHQRDGIRPVTWGESSIPPTDAFIVETGK